jgi:hypothetical protein
MDVLIQEIKNLKEENEKLKKELYKYSHSQKEYYENKTDKTIEIIQLYFDENNKENDGK